MPTADHRLCQDVIGGLAQDVRVFKRPAKPEEKQSCFSSGANQSCYEVDTGLTLNNKRRSALETPSRLSAKDVLYLHINVGKEDNVVFTTSVLWLSTHKTLPEKTDLFSTSPLCNLRKYCVGFLKQLGCVYSRLWQTQLFRSE